MKTYHKTSLIILTLLLPVALLAQNNPDPKTLVNQGVSLNDAGKYKEAIAKYDEALKIDSNFELAYYEKAYTLFASGKGDDAIPILEKLIRLNPNSGGAFDMLGSIYDDKKQPDKAFAYYQQGLKADPQYQRLHFNIAIAYYNQGKYAEAERSALDAVRLDPHHASSQRIYAMACQAEGKRANAILGWCSFLLLEPQTARSANAFVNLKKVLNYGIKRSGEKKVDISISKDDLNGSNLIIPMAVLAATEGKQNLSTTDSLSLELKSVFDVLGESKKDAKSTDYAHFYADYFKKMADSPNMPAFARLISLAVYKEENIKWFKEHQKELTDLDAWVKETPRSF
jgi:tetratricopeptide (TPR) repeat protein